MPWNPLAIRVSCCMQTLKEQVRIVNKRDSNKEKKVDNINEKSDGLIVLSYIEGMTEQFKRVLHRHNFRISMRPVSTLKDQLIEGPCN